MMYHLFQNSIWKVVKIAKTYDITLVGDAYFLPPLYIIKKLKIEVCCCMLWYDAVYVAVCCGMLWYAAVCCGVCWYVLGSNIRYAVTKWA